MTRAKVINGVRWIYRPSESGGGYWTIPPRPMVRRRRVYWRQVYAAARDALILAISLWAISQAIRPVSAELPAAPISGQTLEHYQWEGGEYIDT